jgi:glycogen synthase kinase 3 beta
LEYTPEARLSAIEAMCQPFFDELRVEGARMPNGKDFPPLFDFTREGLLNCDEAVALLIIGVTVQNFQSGQT